MTVTNTRMAVVAGFLTLVAVTTVASAEAAPKVSGLGENLVLTIQVGEVQKGVQRSYRVITLTGESARMLVGWRMPIPTTRTPDDGGEPTTSFVYQNVGMTARLLPEMMGEETIRLRGEIEISASKESELTVKAGMPVIGTFQQDIDVLLRLGKPLRIAEVPDPEGGQRFLEIVAARAD